MAEGIIGKHCWVCKHWYKKGWRDNSFCKFYPTYFERSTLKGLSCGYFEPRPSYRKRGGREG